MIRHPRVFNFPTRLRRATLRVLLALVGANVTAQAAKTEPLPTSASGPFVAVESMLRFQELALGGNAAFYTHTAAAVLYNMANRHPPSIAHWQRARAAAAADGDWRAQLQAENALGLELLNIGDYDASIASAERQILLARAHQAAAFESGAETRLATITRRRGDSAQALVHYERAALLARGGNHRYALQQALTGLGTVYRDLGRFSEALDRNLQALEINRQLGPGYRGDVPYRNIGLLYREIEDGVSARENFEAAIAAARDEFDPTALSSSLGSYATLLNDLGDWERAYRHAEQALAIDAALGNRQGIALENLELARARLGQGQFEEAGGRLATALAIGQAMGQADIVGRALLRSGDLLTAEGQFARAEAVYSASISHLRKVQLKPQLHAAYLGMERLLEKRGATAEALGYARLRAALREELLGLTSARRLAILEFKQERESNASQMQILRMDNQVKALSLRTEALRQRIAAGTLIGLLAVVGALFWRLREVRRLNRDLAERNRAISAQDLALRRANERLTQQASELYQAATYDPLTQVYNRGYLLRALGDMVQRALASGGEVAVMLIDIDRFKPINDNFGHQFGDRVLAEVARVFRDTLREDTLLGRYGGEEFVVALENESASGALTIAERLRHALSERMVSLDGQTIQLTTSIGLVLLGSLQQPSLSLMIAAADEALYAAKRNGRNRVEVHGRSAPGSR
ncbi:MAG: diguanylate cyclase [Lysobacterales bacterium]